MTATRRLFQSSKPTAVEAIADAKVQAVRAGLRVRTLAKVSGKPGDWTIDLAVEAAA